MPDDANDIMDWVFGEEDFEEMKISFTTNLQTPNIKMSMHHIQFVHLCFSFSLHYIHVAKYLILKRSNK